MKLLSTFATVWIAIAILSFAFPTGIASEIKADQETDVTVSHEYFTTIESTWNPNGGHSEHSPTYHNLYVTPTEKAVSFHNHVNIHDERIQSTIYHVDWSITVYEEIDGKLVFVKSAFTDDATYSPPMELYHFQSISIEIDFNGELYHKFYVASEYEWYKVNDDDSHTYIDSSEYGEEAYVYESRDFAVSNGIGTVTL